MTHLFCETKTDLLDLISREREFSCQVVRVLLCPLLAPNIGFDRDLRRAKFFENVDQLCDLFLTLGKQHIIRLHVEDVVARVRHVVRTEYEDLGRRLRLRGRSD